MSITDRAAQWALIVIACLFVLAALGAARDILAPIVLALVTGIVLSPVTDGLDRLGLPHPVAAFGSLATGLLGIVALLLLLQPMVMRTVDAFPSVWRELNSAMYTVRGEIRGLNEIKAEVQGLLDPSSGTGDRSGTSSGDKGEGETGESALPSVEEVIFMAPAIAGQMVIFVGALFFFIFTRAETYKALARRLARPGSEDEAALRLRFAERQVARYFLTISLINLGLGICVGTAMAAIGMPSPAFWGAMAFFLNYFIYVGPAGFVGALLIGGITMFDGLQVLLPAALYLGMNVIESQFVTPTLVGRSLSVNPLLVFLSLVLFMWLWGPIGAVVAIPLLLWSLVLTSDIRQIARAAEPTPGPAR